MASHAEEFFRQITTAPDPFAFLQGLTTSNPPTYESEWLEFKCHGGDDSLKENWGKSLSAFGNVGGGVMIWGIEAKKNQQTGVDAACRVKLVTDTSQCRSRLMELLRDATDPPILGVDIKEYQDPAKAPEGFVVCYIPESTQKPVRSDLPPRGIYWMRVGESTKVMPLPFLRSLFYPQVRARLRVTLQFEQAQDGPELSRPEGQFRFLIHNEGPATAHDVVVDLMGDTSYPFKTCHAMNDRRLVGGLNSTASIERLHPGMTSIAFDGYMPDVKSIVQPLRFKLTLYARDRDAEKLLITANYYDLRRMTRTIEAQVVRPED